MSESNIVGSLKSETTLAHWYLHMESTWDDQPIGRFMEPLLLQRCDPESRTGPSHTRDFQEEIQNRGHGEIWYR